LPPGVSVDEQLNNKDVYHALGALGLLGWRRKKKAHANVLDQSAAETNQAPATVPGFFICGAMTQAVSY